MSHPLSLDPGSWVRIFDNEHFHPGSPDGTPPAEHQRRFGAAVAYNAFGIGSPPAPAEPLGPPSITHDYGPLTVNWQVPAPPRSTHGAGGSLVLVALLLVPLVVVIAHV